MKVSCKKGLLGQCMILTLANAQSYDNVSTPNPGIFNFVNPLIGTVNGGHVFPGATLPFGMAKAVADVNLENQGGFASNNGNITGFSHMHDSGTGGSPSLGNFPLFAQSSCPNDDIDQCKFTQTDRAVPRINGTVVATPGYFSVTTATNINAEMTVSNRTALYRFTFPSQPVDGNSTLSPLILADLIDLPLSRSNGSIAVDDSTGRMTGSGTFNPSFGLGSYTLHFCSDFQGASVRDTGIFINNRAGTEPKNLTVYPDGINISPEILPAGAWVRFQAPSQNNQIIARVGVSFISSEQACSNAEQEIPNFDFDGTHNTARQAWLDALGVVSVTPGGASTDLQTVFWSGLYRNFISPQDYTGENPLWESDQPYYDSYYCIWDSFRSIHSLISLVDPVSQTRMMQSLLSIYEHEGWLPDCRMSLCKGYTQGGSNADVLFSDFYAKNISNPSIDWKTAYEAVVKDAEVEPPVWSVEGRGGLASWKSLGYIPADNFDPYGVGPFTRSISRTVEYAYNDFCVSQLSKAAEINNQADATKYLGRSTNWYNLWQPDQNSSLANGTVPTGFTGYLQPRYLNGTFGFQDPIFCSPLMNFTSCYLNPDGHETYEGSAWLYTFFAPHDMSNLIATLGGDDQFVSRLNYLHETPDLLYVGDEQSFLTIYLYHYAGRPGLSAERIHTYIPSQFNNTDAGIPGNDDSGAMGSFAALSMMGIFPNPGQDVYFITPPFFEQVSIRNKLTGNTAVIKNVNFDGGTGYSMNGTEMAGYENIYIQSAMMNGQPYTKNWLSHSFFKEGGVLELTLGPVESSWGTAEEDRPPSLPLRDLGQQMRYVM